MKYLDMSYHDDLPGADGEPSKMNTVVFFIC